MNYREFSPAPSVARHVERIWVLSGHARELDAASQPILPDGRPELVIHFGEPFERIGLDGMVRRQPLVIFAGQLTEQLTLRPTGLVAVLGIRFHPFGAASLFRTPQHRLAGLTLDLEDLSAPLARALRRIRSMTDSPERAVPFVEDVLERWIDRFDVDPRVRRAAEVIARTRGQISIERLARRTALTRRHLERRFLEAVGLSPKRLARITRFQRALQLLERNGTPGGGVTAAAECGYADQSHFIRDFRALAGCSPSEHVLRQAELTGFFVSS